MRGTRAQCGKFSVPENRSRPDARSIDLNIVLVPAQTKHTDAIFMLAGGPGVGATNMTSFAVETFGPAERDIVLVDARGTGRSHPLHCETADDAQEYFTDLWAPDRIQKCRDKLAPKADLTQYTTRRIVEDLEAIRKELGYKQVTLYGTSYGTRVAQEYMRRHPRSIRAVILDGVVPPSFAMPSRYAENAQRSLTRVLELCQEDEACSGAFPDLEADLAKMLKEAEDGVQLSIPHVRSNQPAKVDVARGIFGEIFRNFLYSPEQYTKLPYVIHQAAEGNWNPFGEMALRYARGIRSLDLGLFLSVTCAEDLPRVDESAVRKASEGTVLGAYRLDQQLGACKVWPRGEVNAEVSKAVQSAIPTLILSGELDPVTPPENGEEVARGLKRALHVVIPKGSHSGDTGGCQEKVFVELVREGSVADLDTTCVKDIARPPFRVK
jgi:pimeloyl-ACP methyl ester carboxylesterase